MTEYKLSYVLTTHNKLNYLKVTVPYLIDNIKDDEEIIITDGASTDGSYEYLKDLYDRGFINKFNSEPDIGQAHGINKAILMAEGKLIKIITDDDVYSFPSIQSSKSFMLEHEYVDVLAGNYLNIDLNVPNIIMRVSDTEKNYMNWYKHGKPGWFSDLTLMIRQSSLSKTGLFNPYTIQLDTEYTFRITAMNINIAWNTAAIALRIYNQQSTQLKFKSILDDERVRISYFYDKQINEKISMKNRSLLDKLEINKLLSLNPFKSCEDIADDETKAYYAINETVTTEFNGVSNLQDFNEIFMRCKGFLDGYNNLTEQKFIFNNN